MNRTRTALVGAFVLIGVLLFGGGLFLIGDRRLFFAKQFELNTTLTKVTGLQVGTRVRLAGLDAGEVLDLVLPPRPSAPFVVRMRIREDLRPLIRTDSIAAVQTDGLVGNAFIQIRVGSDDAPPVEPGGTIEGMDAVEFADLLDEGRNTFRVLAGEVVDLKGDVSNALVTLTDTVGSVNAVITSTGEEAGRLADTTRTVMTSVNDVVVDARALVTSIRQGEGTIGQFVTDRQLYDRLTGMTREAETTMRTLRETSERARNAIEGFTSPTGTGQQITQTLRNTLAQVQEVTSDLAEGTEALKRNFLFRGFFRDRGFFDLDTVSREAYRGGALEGGDRTALRIWIDANGLFERGPDGVEQLTAAGRRRVDSAMADFVRYPRDSPLVVEGYADATDGAAPYLISDDRAQVVREYLVSRFRRQTTLTGVMAMSNDAPGSPRGDGRWSGVALTLFVRNDALAPGTR